MDFKDNHFLIESLREGNESAYFYVVEIYSHQLFSYALSLINDHALAQDIVQNVFINTWRYRKKLDSKFSLASFLHKATYNEFTKQYHQKKTISRLEKKYYESLEKATQIRDKDNLDEIMSVINREIEKLPPKSKEVFLLSKKEGLSNIEISAILGISTKTIEGHITKAYKILRANLKEKLKPFFFFCLFSKNLSKWFLNLTSQSVKF